MSTTEKPQDERGRRTGANGLGVFVPTLVVLALLLGLLLILSYVWTEVLWYEQLGALRVFLTRWGWALALGVVGTVLVTLAASLNFAFAGRKAEDADDSLAEYRRQIGKHRWLSRVVVPGLLGLVFGAPLASEWRTYVLWLNRSPFNETDPQFGRDVSFYVFTLPVLHSLLSLAIIMLAISTVAAAIGHYLYGGLSVENGRVALNSRARMHIGFLGAFGALVVAGYFWLSRYDMLLGSNQRFAGASFTDINASLPGRTILAITAAIIAILFVVAALRGVWKLAVTGIVTALVAGLVVTTIYPFFVQRFQVVPNAVETESPYIQRNIDATLKAYGIDNVEKTEYSARSDVEAGQLLDDTDTTAQIRLLDPNIISPTFNQLQQNKPYYHFADQLSVDRYTIDETARDTVISVRELRLAGLNDDQRTWVNDHTVYTHGYGVVAALGNTTTEKGLPAFYEQGIPSRGEMGEYEPRVYFGMSSPDYSVVGAPKGTKPWELDYPNDSESGQVATTYAGDGGPSIGSTWNKLMFSIRFRDTDLFFSDRVTSESQILFNRDPRDRVAKVAPYLTLDGRVYPAVVDMDDNPDTPKRLVWIIDGYTTTNQYPYSERQSLESARTDAQSSDSSDYGTDPERVNYIRNSVKAVVDAYDGSVKLYKWDKKDPILNAWSKVFPGTLTNMDKMSGDLMSHMRYPEDLFKVQRTLLSRYHVTDAAAFYSGGDFWSVPQEPTASQGSSALQPPYYLTLKMPGQETAEFSLSTSFILSGSDRRNIMTGFLAVDSEAGSEPGKVRDGYGKLRLLELPRNVTVPGPGQAHNNFVTNSTVSQTLNLLRQGGTEVVMGNLLTLPVGGGLLYVQPVYVRASSGSTSYPISQYVLTAFGDSNNIGFAPTLEESLNQTFGGDSGAQAGDADVSGQKEAPSTDGDSDSDTSEPTQEPSQEPTAEDTPAPAEGDAASAQQELQQALADAKTAVDAANTARESGDWGAFGQAQQDLENAINRAYEAQ
ncbi:MAG: UPF0182 family protein, partial [Actinomycetaceae bacterium]|nr:UPF0182 family protein [Actinomycetaceae bacterium]